MLTGVVALSIALAAVQAYQSLGRLRLRLLFVLCMIALLYVSVGGVATIFAFVCLLLEIRKKECAGRKMLLFASGCVLVCILLPLLAKNFFWLQYPLSKLYVGANYYRFQTVFPFSLLLLWSFVAVVFALHAYVPEKRKSFIGTGIQIAVLLILALYGIYKVSDRQKEEVMKYDYFARTRQWSEIIRTADRKTPASPLSVALLNLALCKQGLMADRMFNYFQNGAEGLIPSFVRDFTIPMMSGEIYYHLGFVNTAQRFAFEAMEAIPDYQKSSRAVKRLAETNLINGEYAVAAKYLRMLQHTLYYKKWADKTMACLSDEKLIAANTEWAEIRKYRTNTDFLFSEDEKDMMLGILLQQNLNNRFAYEYLMAYCLLTKDLKHFWSYYNMGKNIAYKTLPLSYQEALVYIWGLSNKSFAAIPYPVSDNVKRRVEEYGRIYTAYPDAETMLKQHFSGSYWYYLHFRK
jgi:hypothetical protein